MKIVRRLRLNLKNLYIFSLSGWALMFSGLGWLALAHLVQINSFNVIMWVGLVVTITGLAIVIKTLSTIRKIDLVFDTEVDV